MRRSRQRDRYSRACCRLQRAGKRSCLAFRAKQKPATPVKRDGCSGGRVARILMKLRPTRPPLHLFAADNVRVNDRRKGEQCARESNEKQTASQRSPTERIVEERN